MFNKFFSYLKKIFYLANAVLIILYLFPGSILGWILYKDAGLQPQITSDFIVSSNHVYAFITLSLLGYISYEREKLNLLFVYLFFISISLELMHIIIPNRGFEFSDLFGNILGVVLVYFFFQLHKYFNNLKNENKEIK